MHLFILIVFILAVRCQIQTPNVTMASEMAIQYGYPFEEHFVTTDDGYILRLFRIPHGRSRETQTTNGPPILFMHSLFLSSLHYMEHGPELSPAFYFVNRGYDVWLLNSRGNYFSRNHTSLNPDIDKEFWSFDFINISDDVKPSIAYILSVTGYRNLITFSSIMSSTFTLIAESRDPDFFHESVSISILL